MYLFLLTVPVLILPALKIKRIIGNRLFFSLFSAQILAVYFEVLYHNHFVSVIPVILFAASFIIKSSISRHMPVTLPVIVLYYDEDNGHAYLYDGCSVKKYYSKFERIYHAGEILRIDNDFWKNI